MKLIYVAHPFGGLQSNADKAEVSTAVLNLHVDRAIFICPWIPMVRNWIDSGEHRKRGLMLDCETVKRCDGLLLIGTHSAGMRAETSAATEANVPTFSVTSVGLTSEQLDVQDWVDSIGAAR